MIQTCVTVIIAAHQWLAVTGVLNCLDMVSGRRFEQSYAVRTAPSMRTIATGVNLKARHQVGVQMSYGF